MDTQLILPLIITLQNAPAEIVSALLLVICTLSMLILFRRFGAYGLYLYNIVAILASNIQVLRGVQFSMSTEPVALGTVVFSTTYLCSDILTEHYGSASAKKGVWYCFSAQILMTFFMILAVSHPPLQISITSTPEAKQMILAERAMQLLFTPSPRLLLASLLAFAISQFNDIWIFQYLNKRSQGKWLWLRTSVSTLISAGVDTTLFSVLAWIILSPQPITLHSLIFTYILGTFITRALIGFVSTPVLYLSYLALPARS